MTVRTKTSWMSTTVILVLVLVVGVPVAGAEQLSSLERKQAPLEAFSAGSLTGQARKILDASDVHGGLIVHIGCGDGKLTAALRANDSPLGDGLESET